MNKLSGKELEELIEDRKAALSLATDAAIRGDPICGGMFALESLAQRNGLGFIATTMQDYDDEDDSIRPF